ncbi:PH domain-containing protein [Flavobacterium macrobrachii]|uniref:PH domain-containing protein n=1 Tax=Flavobacterium macrobrachii TaxID=591204 RepID=A0ABS2CY55_9FLAO|nr:PH domain-containing protein [Flavobacterium macrobrachii]
MKNKFDEIYISPKEKQLFIDEMLKINPNIEIKI